MTESLFSTLFVASIEDSLRDINGSGMYIENEEFKCQISIIQRTFEVWVNFRRVGNFVIFTLLHLTRHVRILLYFIYF